MAGKVVAVVVLGLRPHAAVRQGVVHSGVHSVARAGHHAGAHPPAVAHRHAVGPGLQVYPYMKPIQKLVREKRDTVKNVHCVLDDHDRSHRRLSLQRRLRNDGGGSALLRLRATATAAVK